MAICIDDGQESGMERAEGMNNDAKGTSATEPTSEMLLQMQRRRGAKLRKTVPALDSSSSVRWKEEPSKRMETTEERLGIGPALRSG